MKNLNEIYVSVDIEANGPIPGPHSMLSFGSVAFKMSGEFIDTFYRKLTPIPGSTMHPDTQKFWDREPLAWAEVNKDQEAPEFVMYDYCVWLEKLAKDGNKKGVVFVGYPASFDFMFIYWYLMKYVGRSPFSFSALDIKSQAMVVTKNSFRNTVRARMPKEWFNSYENLTKHNALSDAISQAHVFINMWKEINKNGAQV